MQQNVPFQGSNATKIFLKETIIFRTLSYWEREHRYPLPHHTASFGALWPPIWSALEKHLLTYLIARHNMSTTVCCWPQETHTIIQYTGSDRYFIFTFDSYLHSDGSLGFDKRYYRVFKRFYSSAFFDVLQSINQSLLRINLNGNNTNM